MSYIESITFYKQDWQLKKHKKVLIKTKNLNVHVHEQLSATNLGVDKHSEQVLCHDSWV